MKNIIVAIMMLTLVISPIFSHAETSSSKMPTDQTNLLIQLLLEKVKVLQLELENLIKAKQTPTKVEITDQNADYKKAVGPLLDKIENKEKAKKEIVKKLNESQCLESYRQFKDGKTTVTCKDTNPAPVITMDTPMESITARTSKSKDYIEDLKTLDEEITDIEENIESLKTRYGI